MIFLRIILILSLLHCSSLDEYTRHRVNDLRDVFTLGVEKNNVGASVFIWCFGGGLNYNNQGMGYGLRGGNLGE
ncbi:MAG: hypothetical protein SFU98_08130 [Leptospiraceae bacterium]|nr:hypothetical protein [Leptospiraceae bacterium]